MSFDIDPSFRNSGKTARHRKRGRALRKVGLVLGVLAGIAGGLLSVLWWLEPAEDPATQGTGSGIDAGQFEMVQTDTAETVAPRARAQAAFIDLARDPMILHLEQTGSQHVTTLPGPADLVPERAGGPSADRLSVLQDTLFVSQSSLVTTLPSTRDDFALFQASRSEAIAEATLGPAGALQSPRAAPRFAQTVEQGDPTAPAGEDGAQIDNMTSVAVAVRETQRYLVFQDDIAVMNTNRNLVDVLADKDFDSLQANQIDQAVTRILGLPTMLQAGSIIALRSHADPQGKRLLQMSLYGPEGYLATLAQIGPGRFARGADPWLKQDLMARAGQLRDQGPLAQDIRLLDALYSAAIRNGLATNLVGEMIVMMSQLYDLERFVTDGDRVRMLFASHPGPGVGAGQLLYVGISGPSGAMPCYVTRTGDGNGYRCYAPGKDAEPLSAVPQSGLGNGFALPVKGVIRAGFGPRPDADSGQVIQHDGVDWAAPVGTPVQAVVDGTVTRTGEEGDLGAVIGVDHGEGVESLYAHLKTVSAGIKVGVNVRRGQTIGTVGATGRASAPHLYFELRVAGKPVDPMTYGRAAMDDAVAALVTQIVRVESAGVATARNSRSTATGLGQFIESTWLRMMRDYRPGLTATLARPDLLNLRTDPELSRDMIRNLARENEAYLLRNGHRVTPGRLYLAHFLGPAGAVAALDADPASRVLQVMGPAVIAANPFLVDKTIADLLAWSDQKMRGAHGARHRPEPVPPEVAAFRRAVDDILKSAS